MINYFKNVKYNNINYFKNVKYNNINYFFFL